MRAEAVRLYASGKGPYLAGTGALIPGSMLYPDSDNSIIELPEVQASYGRSRIFGSTNRFGSSTHFDVQPGTFVLNVFLRLVLPATMPADTYLPAGWGYKFIQNLFFTFGSSSITNVNKNGISNWSFLVGMCRNNEEIQSWLNFGGNELKNGTIGLSEAERTAIVFVRLPWVGPEQKIGVDTSLIKQPIQVNVDLANLINVASGAGMLLAQPTGFEAVQLVTRQMVLSDQSVSLRNVLVQDPSRFVGYHYDAFSNFNASVILGAGDAGMEQSFNLTSIINGDLTCIMVHVVDQIDDPSNSLNGRAQPLLGQILQDVRVELNGQIMFTYDTDTYEAGNLPLMKGTESYLISARDNPAEYGTAAPVGPNYSSSLQKGLTYKFFFSQYNSLQEESERMQNVPRYQNMTFQMFFTSLTGNRQLNFYVTYIYNAVYMIGQAGGTTKLVIA